MSRPSRPRHSWEGFVRTIQMSENRLWIFVEGSLDLPFYDAICANNSALQDVRYEVALAQEVPGFAGDGKAALLRLYSYLRHRKMLVSDLAGKLSAVLFILDKDVDDLRGRKARSAHVLYTEHFCMENYLFRFGKLCMALASAAHLRPASVRARIGTDAIAWTKRAATNWKAWVEYCVLVNRLRLTGLPNYGRQVSPIHSGPYGGLDAEQQNKLYASAEAKSGLTISDFTGARERTGKYVDRLYSQGEHDRIFNGKWYRKFLARDAKTAAGGRHYRATKLQQRLIDCLLPTLNFSGGWAAHFHRALDRAARLTATSAQRGRPSKPRINTRRGGIGVV